MEHHRKFRLLRFGAPFKISICFCFASELKSLAFVSLVHAFVVRFYALVSQVLPSLHGCRPTSYIGPWTPLPRGCWLDSSPQEGGGWAPDDASSVTPRSPPASALWPSANATKSDESETKATTTKRSDTSRDSQIHIRDAAVDSSGHELSLELSRNVQRLRNNKAGALRSSFKGVCRGSIAICRGSVEGQYEASGGSVGARWVSVGGL
jgi:hypothetical protein